MQILGGCASSMASITSSAVFLDPYAETLTLKQGNASFSGLNIKRLYQLYGSNASSIMYTLANMLANNLVSFRVPKILNFKYSTDNQDDSKNESMKIDDGRRDNIMRL
jgi:hypothetical protein